MLLCLVCAGCHGMSETLAGNLGLCVACYRTVCGLLLCLCRPQGHWDGKAFCWYRGLATSQHLHICPEPALAQACAHTWHPLPLSAATPWQPHCARYQQCKKLPGPVFPRQHHQHDALPGQLVQQLWQLPGL